LSVCRSTHAPLQQRWLPGQQPDGQHLAGSQQTPLQSIWPVAVEQTQAPFTQVLPPVHFVPQMRQFLASVSTLVQAPPQHSEPTKSGQQPEGQQRACSQQAPWQLICHEGQTQMPFTQVFGATHVVVQLPQCAELESTSTHW
jgi:hypothetical protein